MFVLATHHQSGGSDYAILGVNAFVATTLRSAAIVDGLTSATRVEDLAVAFAWVAESCTSDSAQSALARTRNRAISIHGPQHNVARICTRP